MKEALKGRFRKNVVEYPHRFLRLWQPVCSFILPRCVEAPRARPIIDLASVKGSTLISEERNYAGDKTFAPLCCELLCLAQL